MVPAIGKLAQEIINQPASLDIKVNVIRPIQLVETEAIPIALILNELIVNAVKHSPNHNRVTVSLTAHPDSATISISNIFKSLPADDFDFRTGKGLGTGLELVNALLPHSGADLTIKRCANQINAELVLSPPVIEGL